VHFFFFSPFGVEISGGFQITSLMKLKDQIGQKGPNWVKLKTKGPNCIVEKLRDLIEHF